MDGWEAGGWLAVRGPQGACKCACRRVVAGWSRGQAPLFALPWAQSLACLYLLPPCPQAEELHEQQSRQAAELTGAIAAAKEREAEATAQLKTAEGKLREAVARDEKWVLGRGCQGRCCGASHTQRCQVQCGSAFLTLPACTCTPNMHAPLPLNPTPGRRHAQELCKWEALVADAQRQQAAAQQAAQQAARAQQLAEASRGVLADLERALDSREAKLQVGCA